MTSISENMRQVKPTALAPLDSDGKSLENTGVAIGCYCLQGLRDNLTQPLYLPGKETGASSA